MGVNMKENGCAVLQLTRAANNNEAAPINQGICSLNPKQTFELLQRCGLADNLAPEWSKK